MQRFKRYRAPWRIDPFRVLAGCRKRRLNQALSALSLPLSLPLSLSLSTGFWVLLLFTRATCYVWKIHDNSLPLYAFCVLIVLVKLSVLAKWLVKRLLWGSLFVVSRSSPQRPGRRALMTFPFLFIVSLFYCLFFFHVPALNNNLSNSYMARYSLFVLKMPLINQPTWTTSVDVHSSSRQFGH